MPGIKDPPTMSSENPKFDEIRKVILSLLLSRKGLVPVPVLDRDYYEMEGERIPWRKFGFTDLVAFLKSMPQHVTLEWQNGCQCVRGIASEKSKHVSSLVSRQRNDLKARTSHLRNSHSYSHPHRSNPRYIPHMQRQQYRIPPEQLHFIVQCVRNHPNGLKIQKILAILQQQLPRITLSIHDVCRQLRELSHQISLDGDVIYPVRSNDAPQEAATCQNSSVPQMRPAYRDLQTETVCVAGDEEGYEIADTSFEEPYSVPGCARSNYHKGQSTGERLAGNFSQGAYHEQMTFEYNSHGDNKKTDGYFTANCNNIDNNKSDSLDDRCADISTLIHGRIKGRLEQLIRKYPEGIYCTELPDKYLEEYKVRLNYNELGFSSVREYVSYLPNIFYMTHVASADDFKLFSADKRPTIPEETSASQKTESTTRGSLPDKRHDEQIPAWKQYNSDDAVPTNVSPTITSKFTPDDVMNHKDSVKVISVTDLQRKKYQEVYLAEVFTPSFFWIHLRENKSLLLSLMGNLQSFYVANHQSYAIPKVSLSKGLNCACVFSQRWHRAIIKSVKPDFRVTVMFYDFGTLKTYPPEHIYYLHKQFSHLPALAIPCGLYGIKPCVGDRWKKSVTEQFADKTGDNLLVADIVSVDLPHNSMMVTLTDRSEEEHVNLNDWLVNQNLARQGKLGDAVDMTNLMKYVLNNLDQLPMYCYAEENLIADYCSKTTSTEEIHEVPLVSPGETLLSCSNQKQQQPLRPPPGFSSLNSSNIYSLDNSSLFKVETNPFLNDEPVDTIPTNLVKQTFAQTWTKNTKLQVKLSRMLYNLLERSTVKKSIFDNYIMKQREINSLLKDMEKMILADNDGVAVGASNPNEMSSHDVGHASRMSFQSNDEFASLNPSNLFSDDKSTMNQTAFNPTYCDMNSFLFKNNWAQSAGEFNPRVQVPAQLNPVSTIFDNYGSASSSSYQTIDHENKSVPLMESLTAGIANTAGSTDGNASSAFASTILDVHNPTMYKETNPFRLAMAEAIQIPESAQSAQEATNYNSNPAYYTSVNPPNNILNVKHANVYPTTDVFSPTTHACDVNNVNYTTRIIYEAGPVMYNAQKKEVAINQEIQDGRVTSFTLKPCDAELPSQLIDDMAAFSLKRADEDGVETRSTKPNPQTSSLKAHNETKYQRADDKVNKPQDHLAQSWRKPEIPERWINSKFEDSFSHAGRNNSNMVSTSASHETYMYEPPYQNCDNNNEVNARDFNSVNDLLDHAFQSNNEERSMDRYKYIEIANCNDREVSVQNDLSRSATSEFFFKNCFVFRKIDTVKGVTFLFHIEENGWILLHEFVKTFTEYELCSSLKAAINPMNMKILLQEIKRSDYPAEFTQLDKYSIDVPRDEEKRIISINLISLQTALVLLCKLNIVSREEMNNAFKKNEFVEGSVLTKMWSLILGYRQLRQNLEEYINAKLSFEMSH